MIDRCEVHLWGTHIGSVASISGPAYAFEYTEAFLDSGIEISPLRMPLARRIYTFPDLAERTFKGLPGLLADTLPDKFGQAVIRAWLASQGRSPDSFSPIEQLCYIGTRGNGALEFHPVNAPAGLADTVQLEQLTRLAQQVLSSREDLHASFATDERRAALAHLLQVSSSVGGARAKALIAWNPDTHEVRSGQVPALPGFEHWLLKFDGVSNNADRELTDPLGYTVAEYAYSRMAHAAGITMSECRLLEDGNRRHFMTRRFDRPSGRKLHMQSLGALAHLDFNEPVGNTYEEAFGVLWRTCPDQLEAAQLYRRMLFNVIARNQDDHVKNIAFLMNRQGQWSLAPAYDLAFNHNPRGAWTSRHQMSLNGRRDGFTRQDFNHVARAARISAPQARDAFEAVHDAVSQWPRVSQEAGVPQALASRIQADLRLEIPLR